MEMLIEYLKFCVEREKDGKINPLNTQNNFNKFYKKYKGNENNLRNPKYKGVLDAIINAHETILDKKDETAMEYSEKGYTKVLTNNTSYKLTEEEDITNLNSKAFITTAIILEGSVIATLILSLLALVK